MSAEKEGGKLMEILNTQPLDYLEMAAPDLSEEKKSKIRTLMGGEDNWWEVTIRHAEYMSLEYQMMNPDNLSYQELTKIQYEWRARLVLLLIRDKSIDREFIWNTTFWEVMKQIGEEEVTE